MRRLEREDFGAGIRLGVDADLNLGKRWNVFGHRVRQRQPAFLDQHHRRETCDRLSHRMQCKNGIRRHRPLGGDVANAEAFEIDRPAVLLDQYDRARQLPGRDFVVEKFSDALEFGH